MSEDVNLKAYFERIAFAGSIAPTLPTLQALHAAHPLAIPFENLNPLLRLPVALDLRSIEQKLLHERRGGWCYEHNILFMEVLRTLEFEVRPLAARVLWDVPEDTITRRSHMLLLVDIGGAQYIADVGFGGVTPTAPLRLRVDVEQETPHEVYRITGGQPDYRVQVQEGDGWRTMFRFDLSEHHPIDFEAANWYLATNPASKFFRENLVVVQPEKGRRLSLLNNRLTTRTLDGDTETRMLGSVDEIKEVLTGTFAISLPPAEQLDPVLERIVAKTTT